MSAHGVQVCPKPKPSRRWRNALWVCPTCQRAWTLRFTLEVAPRAYDDQPITALTTPGWQWWPWPVPTAG